MEKNYGINMKKWCKMHECEIEALTSGEYDIDSLRQMLDKHEKKLSWLMHERLIHLIVLFLTVVLVIFSFSLLMCVPDTYPGSLILSLIVFVLTCFYVRHYFFLENTVQKWYGIDEELNNLLTLCYNRQCSEVNDQ